jgi:AcrR family transcriptional regulator
MRSAHRIIRCVPPTRTQPAGPATQSEANGDGRRYGGLTAAERRADRRARLLDAALQLFATTGYAATTIEELCTAASISTRTFYEEVSGREELLLLLHDRILREAEEAAIAALMAAPSDDVRARATAAMRAYVEAMTRDPRHARLAYVEAVGVSPALEAQRHAWMRHFARLIAGEAQSLAQRGLAPRRDHSLTGMAVVGAIDRLIVHWAASSRRPSRERLVTEMSRFIVGALTAD